MAEDGKVIIGTELDDSGLQQGLNEVDGKATKSFGKVAKVATAAGVAGATAIGKIAKESIEAYASYEQLVGGVDTLFKESSKQVQQYAANAYKTAGLSANQYMETVTSFSASLLQSLGGDTEKSAQAADQAIIDMSDNANKMGTNMQDIQNAYQGFAKQNFTMLDNLKLGYGGTKTEMERLLADAEKLTGKKYDVSNFADITEAIHVIQTEMDITGTTAKEASTTIEGSVNSMKSAWQNLLVGIADDNADFSGLIDQFVESVSVAFSNILPRVEQILQGIGQLVAKIVPIVVAQIPSLLTNVLPSLINAGMQMILGIVDGLAKGAPELVSGAVSVVDKFVDGLDDNLPKIITAAINLVMALVSGIIKNLPKLVQVALKLVVVLAKAIITNLPTIAKAGVRIIKSLVSGILSLIGLLGSAGLKLINRFVSALKNGIGSVKNIGLNLVKGLWNGISGAVDWIVGKVKGFGKTIINALTKVFDIHSPSKVTAYQGKMLALGVVEGIKNNQKYAVAAASKMGQKILDAAEKKLANTKVYHTVSLAAEVKYWDTIRKKTKKGTQQRIDADKQYYDAKKELTDSLQKLDDDYYTNAKAISDNLKKDIDDLNEAYEQAVSERAKAIYDSMKLFEGFQINEELSGETMTSNLQSQVDGLKRWRDELARLKVRNIPDELLSELEEMGPDALGYLIAFNKMSDIEFGNYVELWQEKKDLARQQAEDENRQLKIDTENQIAQLKQQAEDSLKELTKQYVKDLNALGVTTKTKGYKIGTNIVDGVRSGLSSKRASLMAYVKSYFNDIVKTAKATLDIHSPSKVFKEMGEYSIQGYLQGFDNGGISQVGNIIKNGLSSVRETITMQTIATTSSAEPITMNFYDTQTSPDAIYQKFYQQQTFGFAREV